MGPVTQAVRDVGDPPLHPPVMPLRARRETRDSDQSKEVLPRPVLQLMLAGGLRACYHSVYAQV